MDFLTQNGKVFIRSTGRLVGRNSKTGMKGKLEEKIKL